jgi:hypothetical protein
LLAVWFGVGVATALSDMRLVGWPKPARDYWNWAMYQADTSLLPFQFEVMILALAALLLGFALLWLLRRTGLPIFCAGLVMALYATFPVVPDIVSGLTATLDALSWLLAGLIVASGLFGGILTNKQANPSMQPTGEERPAAD